MAGAEGNPGISRLARAIDSQMKRYHSDIIGDLTIDFGVIGGDYSLQVNSFPHPIPKGEYYVCRQLTLGKTDEKLTTTKTDGAHGGHLSGDGSHSHTVVIPENMRKIKPGDHVLIVWIQNEVCVIDVIVSSSKL